MTDRSPVPTNPPEHSIRNSGDDFPLSRAMLRVIRLRNVAAEISQAATVPPLMQKIKEMGKFIGNQIKDTINAISSNDSSIDKISQRFEKLEMQGENCDNHIEQYFSHIRSLLRQNSSPFELLQRFHSQLQDAGLTENSISKERENFQKLLGNAKDKKTWENTEKLRKSVVKLEKIKQVLGASISHFFPSHPDFNRSSGLPEVSAE